MPRLQQLQQVSTDVVATAGIGRVSQKQANVQGWHGVDLDGTLAQYTEWKGDEYIGRPIKKMVARIKRWLDNGENVKILSTRGGNGDAAAQAIGDWTFAHFGKRLPVTDKKDQYMIDLWDDRAHRVEKNTGIKQASTAYARVAQELIRQGHIRAALRILGKATPKGVVRSLGRAPLGYGVEARVYPSFTGGKGLSATKVFRDGLNRTLAGLPITRHAKLMAAFPDIFPSIYKTHPRGFTMERLRAITTDTPTPALRASFAKLNDALGVKLPVPGPQGQHVTMRISDAAVPFDLSAGRIAAHTAHNVMARRLGTRGAVINDPALTLTPKDHDAYIKMLARGLQRIQDRRLVEATPLADRLRHYKTLRILKPKHLADVTYRIDKQLHSQPMAWDEVFRRIVPDHAAGRGIAPQQLLERLKRQLKQRGVILPASVKQAALLKEVPMQVISTTLAQPKAKFVAEIADNPEARARGLSKRAALPENRGMFFDINGPFWMKDVNFPLDLVHLTKEGEVLGIQTMKVDLRPDRVKTRYWALNPKTAYTIELPGEWCKRHAVVPGDRIIVDHV